MEFLSHLPSTSPSANPLRPTLFELIAQDQLRDLIQPALGYIIRVRRLLSLAFLNASFMLSGTLDNFSGSRRGSTNYTPVLCYLLTDGFSSLMVTRSSAFCADGRRIVYGELLRIETRTDLIFSSTSAHHGTSPSASVSADQTTNSGDL